MECITTTKGDYRNIPDKLLELPYSADTDERDVILADGEQWKSDVGQPRELLAGTPQCLNEQEKLEELVTLFHLVSGGNCQYIKIHTYVYE